MPFNGSGVYALPSTTVTPAVSGTTIDSSEFNTFTADLETALTLCVAKDGQTSSPILTNPKILTKILDTNSNELVEFGTTASAVNHVKTTNAATGNAASIAAVGDDTNIDLSLAGKGSGGAYGTLTTHTSSPFATTSGTSVTASSIPSWVKRIIVSFYRVSMDGTGDALYLLLGDSGGIETTGYEGVVSGITGTNTTFSSGNDVGILLNLSSAQVDGSSYSGECVITLEDASNFNYTYSAHAAERTGADTVFCAGSKSLDTVLTQLQLLVSGGGSFDVGSFSVHYEG